MYAVYNYKAGATQAQVIADLVLILTGTTNTASLSASSVTANCSISASIAVAGWTVFDASAGTNTQCLRAQNQDGSTFKYMTLAATSTTVFTFQIQESWNAGTHAGTNAPSATPQTWDAVNGGYFYIYATAKNIVIMPWTTAGGYLGVKGSVFEFSRDSLPATYPCHAILSSNPNFGSAGNANVTRYKNLTTAGDTVAVGGAFVGYIGIGANAGGLYRDASENQYLAMYPVGVAAPTSPVFWGTCYDVKSCAGVAAINNLDEITYSGTTYVCFLTNGSGTPVVFVPKG